jgi:hypothetical protein
VILDRPRRNQNARKLRRVARRRRPPRGHTLRRLRQVRCRPRFAESCWHRPVGLLRWPTRDTSMRRISRGACTACPETPTPRTKNEALPERKPVACPMFYRPWCSTTSTLTRWT